MKKSIKKSYAKNNEILDAKNKNKNRIQSSKPYNNAYNLKI